MIYLFLIVIFHSYVNSEGNIFQLSPGHFKNHPAQRFRHPLPQADLLVNEGQSAGASLMGHWPWGSPRMGTWWCEYETNKQWGSRWKTEAPRTIVRVQVVHKRQQLSDIGNVVQLPTLAANSSCLTVHVSQCPCYTKTISYNKVCMYRHFDR